MQSWIGGGIVVPSSLGGGGTLSISTSSGGGGLVASSSSFFSSSSTPRTRPQTQGLRIPLSLSRWNEAGREKENSFSKIHLETTTLFQTTKEHFFEKKKAWTRFFFSKSCIFVFLQFFFNKKALFGLPLPLPQNPPPLFNLFLLPLLDPSKEWREGGCNSTKLFSSARRLYKSCSSFPCFSRQKCQNVFRMLARVAQKEAKSESSLKSTAVIVSKHFCLKKKTGAGKQHCQTTTRKKQLSHPGQSGKRQVQKWSSPGKCQSEQPHSLLAPHMGTG